MFQTAVYNQTVTITEPEEGLDGETWAFTVRLHVVISHKAAGSSRQASPDDHSRCRSLSTEVWNGYRELLKCFSGTHVRKRHQWISQTKQMWFVYPKSLQAGCIRLVVLLKCCTCVVIVQTVWASSSSAGSWAQPSGSGRLSQEDTRRDINAPPPALF